ncbi:MAG: type II toxin-antitoxin system HicB family antitoxin [Firmicutes bacterium]|nr:type II toxin-antitoxin system HicB family antitoxin [Bacillota bacterium]
MANYYTAYIERDNESGLYIGVVPSIVGARTCAETIDELQIKLEEVITLCLEEMDADDVQNIPIFAGISQIKVAI